MLMVMDPNTPPAPPPMQPGLPPQPDSQYDFIVNPGQPKKKTLLPSGYSKKQKVLFVIIGLVILFIGYSLLSSFLGGADKSNKEQLVSVVNQQRELIRISEIGVKKAKGTEARNLATTTQLSLISEQKELEAAVRALGVKVKGSGKNSKTDELFTKAEQANNFDAVFIEKLQADLLKYAKSVKTAYENNSSTKTKKDLEAQFNNAATLANFKE